MACGLPIVTTDAGGIQDILPPEQKPFMVDRNNREEFSKALIKLSKDTPLLNNLRQINREWVQRYSTENVAVMYLDVLFKD
jgi:glycosyltransferase involved in cell wall biosynthesis